MDIFKPVIGLYAWGTWWDNQAGTNIEFGNPSLVVDSKVKLYTKGPLTGKKTRWARVKGECGLQLWMTEWTIMEDDDVAATLDSPYEGGFNTIKAALHRLEGKKLESIDINVGTTTFNFDLGGKLICNKFDDAKVDEEMWALKTPDGIHVCLVDGSVRSTTK